MERRRWQVQLRMMVSIWVRWVRRWKRSSVGRVRRGFVAFAVVVAMGFAVSTRVVWEVVWLVIRRPDSVFRCMNKAILPRSRLRLSLSMLMLVGSVVVSSAGVK